MVPRQPTSLYLLTHFLNFRDDALGEGPITTSTWAPCSSSSTHPKDPHACFRGPHAPMTETKNWVPRCGRRGQIKARVTGRAMSHPPLPNGALRRSVCEHPDFFPVRQSAHTARCCAAHAQAGRPSRILLAATSTLFFLSPFCGSRSSDARTRAIRVAVPARVAEGGFVGISEQSHEWPASRRTPPPRPDRGPATWNRPA